jgi:predicted alpha/beta-fold hydrolase
VQVKYLGEEGDSTPVGAAAAVCSPWDLLVGLISFLLLFLTEKDLFIPAQTLYSTLT